MNILNEDGVIYDNYGHPSMNVRKIGNYYITLPYHDVVDEDKAVTNIIEKYVEWLKEYDKKINAETLAGRNGVEGKSRGYHSDWVAIDAVLRKTIALIAFSDTPSYHKDSTFIESVAEGYNNSKNLIGRIFKVRTPSESAMGTNNEDLIQKILLEKMKVIQSTNMIGKNACGSKFLQILKEIDTAMKKFNSKKDKFNYNLLKYLLFTSNVSVLGYGKLDALFMTTIDREVCDKFMRPIDEKFGVKPEFRLVGTSSRSIKDRFKKFISKVGTTYNRYAEDAEFIFDESYPIDEFIMTEDDMLMKPSEIDEEDYDDKIKNESIEEILFENQINICSYSEYQERLKNNDF